MLIRVATSFAGLAALALVASCSGSNKDIATGGGAESGMASGTQATPSVASGQSAGSSPASSGAAGQGSGDVVVPSDLEGGGGSGSGVTPEAGKPNESGSSGQSAGGSGSGLASSGAEERDAGASNGVDAACAPAVSPVVETDPDGPGYDCMTSGCHLPGAPVQGGLTITVSGTLYDANGEPLPGATVFVTDSVGKKLALTTDNNANFWSGYSDGKVMPAANYGTCLSYVMCYPPSQFEGACQCATYAAAGALQAASVSMCPNGTQACGSLGKGASNGDCHTCHGGTGSSPAIRLP
jgi:hypothetical protein